MKIVYRSRTVDVPVIPENVLHILLKLEEEKQYAMWKTLLTRVAGVIWLKLVIKKGKKVPPDVFARLSEVPIEKLRELPSVVEKSCDLLEINDADRRKWRSYAKTLLKRVKQENWLLDLEARAEEKLQRGQKPYRFYTKGIKLKTNKDFPATKASKTSSYGLGTQATHYATDKKGNFIFQDDERVLGNVELHKELKKFAAATSQLSQPDQYPAHIRRLLAYALRQGMGPIVDVNQPVTLKTLRLTTLIPFRKMRFFREDFKKHSDFKPDKESWEDWVERKIAQAEAHAVRETKKEAGLVIKWLEEHFEWADAQRQTAGEPDGLGNGSKTITIDALINLAMLVYQEQTDVDEEDNFNDISIIKRLRKLRRKFRPDSKKQKKRVLDRCIPWEKAWLVLEAQREKADARLRFVASSPYPSRLKPQTVAKELQRFLTLALLMIVPTDRQQTQRHLKYGESLRWGAWIDGEFIPIDELDHPEEAEWEIFLESFKSVDSHGYFRYPIENEVFSDGKTLYEYLEMFLFGLDDSQQKWPQYYADRAKNKKHTHTWQGHIISDGVKTGWRAALNVEHDFVFSRPKNKTPFDESSYCQMIKGIFVHMGQVLKFKKVVAVSPHSLRHMLTTYSQGKATPEEHESLAYCKHHKLEMHFGNYNHAENSIKIAHAQAFMQRTTPALKQKAFEHLKALHEQDEKD